MAQAQAAQVRAQVEELDQELEPERDQRWVPAPVVAQVAIIRLLQHSFSFRLFPRLHLCEDITSLRGSMSTRKARQSFSASIRHRMADTTENSAMCCLP